MRLWSASYLVYLLLVFFPQSSIFRLLVPLSPLWGAFALPRSTAVARRRARRVPGRPVVVDLQHVRAGEYASGRCREPGMTRLTDARVPQACPRVAALHDKLDVQTTDEKEPQWQP